MYNLSPLESAPALGRMDMDVITRSHQRCSGFGLQQSDTPCFDHVSRPELQERLEIHHALYSHALPIMESLHEQIQNTHSMVILTDQTGLIMHALGDNDFLEKADRVALTTGVSWSESSKGTNAVGTALYEARPTVVHGDQHFLQANHFLTCSCAPIFDPHGQVVGALDVSGDYRGFHPHTLALVNMSAQMIGNQLFASAFPEGIRIHFHARAELIGTIFEGIVAFSSAGRFLSANRSAHLQLGASMAALQAHTTTSLFGVNSSQLADHYRSANPSLLTLTTPSGKVVRARAEFRTPAFVYGSMGWSADGESASPVGKGRPVLPDGACGESATERPPSSRSCAGTLPTLASLDTGDDRMALVLARVRKVIGRDIPVLVLGETGTGKELLAHAIHHDSPRASGNFVAVNCASIPEHLIESELFGYQEGAFTGARKKGNLGKIVQADGGTLFLDEIGDMPLALQARLLRVLQDRMVHPLGGSKSIPVDIVVICATNRNLRDMIGKGEFREDLYYRLNGLVVQLPPLRERSDLPVIVERVLQQQCGNGGPYRVADDVMTAFLRYPWPGNIRQLVNILRTATVMADCDGMIRLDDLPDDLRDELQPTAAAAPVCDDQALPSMQQQAAIPAAAKSMPVGDMKLEDLQLAMISAALEQHHGNLSSAARALGVSRNTVYRKLEQLQVGRKRRLS